MGATPQPILSVKELGIRYEVDGRLIAAVENISLDVHCNHRLILLGPSGCGKSSLLKAMGGFVPYQSGQVTLKGAAVSRPSHHQVMVFQEFDQLFSWKTILENVKYPLLRVRRFSQSDATAKAQQMLQRVGLEKFMHQYPHTLSGGMKQRAAIARSLVMEPDVLLMDEPFAALDAVNRRRMQELLLELCEETKATVVFVSHAVDEAFLLGTEIALMSSHPGRLDRLYDLTGSYDRRAIEQEIMTAMQKTDRHSEGF